MPPQLSTVFMKTLLKFTLLSALIIGGKLAKKPASASKSPATINKTITGNSIVMVHQVLTSEPVKPSQQQPSQQPSQQQPSGSGLLTELF